MKPTVVTYADPPQTRARLAFFAIPGASLLAHVALWLTSVGDLPAQTAIHFSGSGTADGFASPTMAFAIPLGMQIALTALFFCMAAAFKFRGPMGRMLSATASFMAGLFLALSVAATLPQRGLATGEGFALSGWTLPVILLLALVVGAAGYLIAPASERIETEGDALPALDAQPGTTLAFSTSVGFGPWFMALTGLVTLMAVLLPWLTQEAFIAIPLGFAALLCLALTHFTITIGAQGVRCRSWIGFTVRHLPLDKIAGASAAHKTAGELGGWGYRFTGSGSGISLGAGTTLLVHPRQGTDWFCSMPEAPTAAATINALLKQRSA